MRHLVTILTDTEVVIAEVGEPPYSNSEAPTAPVFVMTAEEAAAMKTDDQRGKAKPAPVSETPASTEPPIPVSTEPLVEPVTASTPPAPPVTNLGGSN